MLEKKIISKSIIPKNKSFMIRKINEPHFDPTFHAHPEFQLSYVIKGEGNRIVGNNLQPFHANDMVFIGPNLPHVWKNHQSYFKKDSQLDTSVIVIYFDKNFLGKRIYDKDEFYKLNLFFEKSSLGIEIIGETREIIGNMMAELLEKKELESIILLLKILDVLVNSHDVIVINEVYENINYKQAETERIHKVYDYVIKNFNKQIRIEEVAEIASMTNTSFSRFFKTRLNKSFSDFLIEIRISYACKLLKDENIPIETVSYECGYPSVTNFNKQFKKIVGRQPRQYRDDFLTFITIR